MAASVADAGSGGSGGVMGDMGEAWAVLFRFGGIAIVLLLAVAVLIGFWIGRHW